MTFFPAAGPPTDTGPLLVETRTVSLEPLICITFWLAVLLVAAWRHAAMRQLIGERPSVSTRTLDWKLSGTDRLTGPLVVRASSRGPLQTSPASFSETG